MSKTAYHITLKGYVGGYDFDRSTVDNVLAKNGGKQVNVLIDSLGGSLATGLSISAAFKDHGNVCVHFVDLNASAATIASLGASHISIDAGAMYLVHKCSMAFFEWGSLNADQFSTLIADCAKIKADLDKLDLNCAQLYAARCKRKTEDLLDLMKAGGWLTAKEALEWGFVDEITGLADEPAPKLTDALASAMASEGMPIPHIPLSEPDTQSAFARFLSALTSFFKQPALKSISSAMNKTYKFLSAVLADKPLTVTDGTASITEAQLDAIEASLADRDKTINDLKASIEAKDKDLADKQKSIEELRAKLDAKPADASTSVVEDSKKSKQQLSEFDEYISTSIEAAKLYNSLP